MNCQKGLLKGVVIMIKRKNIKKFIASIMIGTIAVMSLVGCSGNSAKTASTESEGSKSKELNVICWSEYLPDDVIKGFEEKYALKVNLTTYTDPDEMLAKVKSSSKGTYDMIIGPAQDTQILKSQDLIQKLQILMQPLLTLFLHLIINE